MLILFVFIPVEVLLANHFSLNLPRIYSLIIFLTTFILTFPGHYPVDFSMVRKKRTGPPGEPSESQQESGGGSRQSSGAQPQRATMPQQQHAASGRGGWTQPHPQYSQQSGNRGGGQQYQPRGGYYQPHGAQTEHYQPRGGPQGRGGSSQQYYGGGGGRRGGMGGGRGGPAMSGPAPPRIIPELHQAPPQPSPQVAYHPSQAVVAAVLSEGGSSSSSAQVEQQLQQLSIQEQGSSSQAIQLAPPPSSKGMRFPLRPGKGTHGERCIVKANHFFAELPDKDLHQYDVSFFGFTYYSPFYQISLWNCLTNLIIRCHQ
jgi:eukaryotic translation initiation factor 2C